MKTYKFVNPETKEIENIEEEKWCWGVVYRPTAEQILEAENIKKERDEKAQDTIRELKNEYFSKGKNLNKTEVESFERRIADKEVILEIPAQPKSDELHQFAQDGTFHRIGEVDQERVKLFVLYNSSDPQRKRIDLIVTDGMKLIHKYRNVKPFYMEKFVKVYMFGYKLGNNYHYNFVLPDDRIIQSPTDDIDLTLFELHRGI